MIIISLILATLLRIYKIGANFYFSGELGKELLFVRELIQNSSFPLVGLPTSHEWLTYGPIYYWIVIPLVRIFGGSPYILFWLALGVSVIGLFLTYLVFRKIVNRKFALILSFFLSVSPLWIWATRLSKLHTFFFVLTPIIIYCLYKIWNLKHKYFFWLGITFGLLFSFHYSQIPILAVILLAFWIKRKHFSIKDYLKFVLGLILPNITVFIYDAQQGFAMIKNLFLWIPYRFAGFLGIYPKNNIDTPTGEGTLAAFNEFFGRNLFWDHRFWILGSLIFVVLFLIFVGKNYKKITKDFFVFYLTASTVVQCLGLFILTTPPLHYFFPIFLNFGLLFTYFAIEYWHKRSTKILTVLIVVLMSVAGVLGMSNEHFGVSDYIPYKIQSGVSDEIVKDANSRPFSLIRLGPFDYFPENYSQNYKYLILEKGGKIDASAKLKYIIYDIGTVYVQKNEKP